MSTNHNPTYEVGKTYRTRGGEPAGVTTIRADGALEGWIDFTLGRSKACWYADGRMLPSREDALDLIHHPVTHDPELDGPREVHEPEYEAGVAVHRYIGEEAVKAKVAGHENTTDRLNKLEAQNTDIMRQLTNLRASDRDQKDLIADMAAKAGELVERVSALEKDVAGYNSIANKLSAHDDRRFAALDARIAKLTEEQANDLAATDTRMDRLSALICPCPAPHPPKPTIKGGWINIYKRHPTTFSLNGAFVTVYDTRAEADAAAVSSRVACIHLPDITEGEDL